jgi:hypothetical protein
MVHTVNSYHLIIISFNFFRDNAMNINEFTALIKALFRNEKGKPYPVDNHLINEIFLIFNKSGDGSISKEEFAHCWNAWIKKIVRPVSALLVIDVQNDFISGSLAITNCPAKQDGEEVRTTFYQKRAFTNYVAKILPIVDHLPIYPLLTFLREFLYC